MNPDLKIFICLMCGYALDEPCPKRVLSHIKGHPTGRKKDPSLARELEEFFEKIGIEFAKTADVKYQPSNGDPIPGILLNLGYYCPLNQPGKDTPCDHAAGTPKSLNSHLKGCHKRDPKRPTLRSLGAFTCYYQTIFSGNNRHYFKVRPVPEGIDDPYTLFVSTVSTTQPRPEVLREGELPSFLRGTRWPTFLQPYRKDPMDVVALIALPTTPASRYLVSQKSAKVERTLCRLPKVSEAWMSKVYSVWEDSSDYVHRILAHYPM